MSGEAHAIQEALAVYVPETADTERVPEGYKQTEVGVIPEEWDVANLASLGAGSVPPIKAGPFGSALTKATYVPSGYKVYGQEQVIRGDYQYGDYFVPLTKYQELVSCSVRPGDILLSLVGTAGKLLVIPRDAPEGIINPRLIRFSFDKARVDSEFFRELFGADQIQGYLERYAQGGTMGVLNANILRAVRIPLPPLSEQRAIAAVLSDVDALISSLDRLVSKKRAVKTAAMQQLLTGKQRLPGFSGEWEVKSLGEVCSISVGKSKSKYINGGGRYLIVDMGSVSTTGKLISTKRTDYKDDFLNLGDLVMPKDDIGGGNIIGKVAYIDEDNRYVLGDHVYVLKARLGSSLFLSYVINGHDINSVGFPR